MSKQKEENIFFLGIVLSNILFFINAFKMYFFKDDFFFIKISKINNIQGFIHFFSPLRTYSYKPLASEVFYFLVNGNPLLGHCVVFVTYFIGLYFLYKSVHLLTKNTLLSRLTIFTYSISSVHVFQLYWLATYQEILVFAALSFSFYYYLQKKYTLSIISYICALLSKETAILYVLFLLLFEIIKSRKIYGKQLLRNLSAYILVSVLFYIIYQYSLAHVTALDNYTMTLNPKRLINNALWYFLWGWGVPSYLSDYMTSIFSKPIPEFWNIIDQPFFKEYIYSLTTYLFVFFSSLVLFITMHLNKLKKIGWFLLLNVVGFFIFLGPMLLFPHRWMVRLTVPLIFITLFQSVIWFYYLQSNTFFKGVFVVLISLYTITCFFGIKVNENTSTYLLESSISKQATKVFGNITRFENCTTIYIKNPKVMKMGSWDGSEKVALTLFGDSFLNHYFPNRRDMKVAYEFQMQQIPQNSCIIDSSELIQNSN